LTRTPSPITFPASAASLEAAKVLTLIRRLSAAGDYLAGASMYTVDLSAGPNARHRNFFPGIAQKLLYHQLHDFATKIHNEIFKRIQLGQPS
jgi:hypothetical protein